MTQMTCDEFFDKHFDNHDFLDQLSVMRFHDSFDSEFLFEDMELLASDMNIKLTDSDTWDYDKVFYTCYKNYEY